jgi:hypothetical protein
VRFFGVGVLIVDFKTDMVIGYFVNQIRVKRPG